MVIVSPTFISLEGFAGLFLTFIKPCLHASVAKVRVLYNRTAQSHLSNRSAWSFSWLDIEEWMCSIVVG